MGDIAEVKEALGCGGFVCPACSSQIITPLGYILIPGKTNCQVCGALIHLSKNIAVSANELRTIHILTNIMLRSPHGRVIHTNHNHDHHLHDQHCSHMQK